MKDPLVLKIKEYIMEYQMIRPGMRVLAGISGGADSVFLLRILEELATELSFCVEAVHVEHGIRGAESLRDAAFVEDLCKKSGVHCRIMHVDAPAFAKEHGIGLEEAARTLRYQVFDQIADEEHADRIAVAHHMEDNAETMLFHLARGTGLTGLAGIPPVRERIIRPLLCISRDEIEQWLSEKGQAWCLDETNADVSFSRNLIRAEILPKLKELNPSAVYHMAETAELLRKTTAFLDNAAKEASDKAESGGVLEVRTLCNADPAIVEHLIYRTLQRVAGSAKDLTREHVKSVYSLIKKDVGKKVSLPYSMIAERTYDSIRICQMSGDSSGQTQETVYEDEKKTDRTIDLQVPGNTKIDEDCHIDAKIIPFDGDWAKIPQNSYTKWFDYDKIKNGLQIRGRIPGDYLQINREGGHKSIQDYMVNEKIPAKERDRMRLLADGNHIVWVIGRRISEAYKVTQETKRVLVLTVTCADDKGEAK